VTILDRITESTRRRVKLAQQRIPLSRVRDIAEALPRGNFAFAQAIRKPKLSFICEVKKASPSKGVISAEFPYLDIARDYEAAGADAISVLTEPEFFLGKDEYLSEISRLTSIPTLRKDFAVSEYQIYEAKSLGASAILLITSILDDAALAEFSSLAMSLGMPPLVETRSESEIERALKANAAIIGVNNRNLSDFSIDMHASEKLRGYIPDDVLFVAESGISSRADISALSAGRPDAVLIGEALMKAADRKRMLQELRAAVEW